MQSADPPATSPYLDGQVFTRIVSAQPAGSSVQCKCLVFHLAQGPVVARVVRAMPKRRRDDSDSDTDVTDGPPSFKCHGCTRRSFETDSSTGNLGADRISGCGDWRASGFCFACLFSDSLAAHRSLPALKPDNSTCPQQQGLAKMGTPNCCMTSVISFQPGRGVQRQGGVDVNPGTFIHTHTRAHPCA